MESRIVLVLCSLIALGAAQRFDSGPWRRPPTTTPLPRPTPPAAAPTMLPQPAPTAAAPLPPLPILTAKSAICERKHTRLPVPGQCDAFVECRNYIAFDMLCPDGLHFNPNAPYNAYPCAYPNEVPCQERSALQPARPTAECQHRYGFYKSTDPLACGSYRMCVDGHAFNLQCAPGLAWDQTALKCDWPDQVLDCDAEAFLGFRCPAITLDKNGEPAAVDRFYSHPTSCYMYFDCVFDRPRLLSCDAGLAFDATISRCVEEELVPTCRR